MAAFIEGWPTLNERFNNEASLTFSPQMLKMQAQSFHFTWRFLYGYHPRDSSL